ncbi:MAG: ATP-binding protein [Aphanizomenon gracile PMC627.10]|nr:ATP-binding protein [Aphanizomenon gracile PMC627.10]
MPRLDQLNRLDKLDRFRGFGEISNGKGNESQISTLEKDFNTDVTPDPIIDLKPYLQQPKYSLKDVVLSAETNFQVQLVFAELKHQKLIYETWGMSQRHKHDIAVCLNFFGLPGLGKTMAAEAIAHELNRPILVIPYAEIQSKFMGDTGKYITASFQFAKVHNAILFFDEADTMLSTRVDVNQSSDSEMNLCRAVLITELSNFQGIIIFATNKLGNYDGAFISRIRWQIEFTLPDEEGRRKIWEAQISEQLPLHESVNFQELASQFDNISGRDIKKAVLQAVVAAACEDKPDNEKCVTQSHFVDAIKQVTSANEAAQKEKDKGKSQLVPVIENVELPPDSSTEL